MRTILGDNFCGAYLQGSFAIGAADEHSDVDFIVVTHGEVTDRHLASLQAMHGRIYRLESPWAQHLEGSYISKGLLRRVDPERTPLLFLDNGATELVRDDHCNTAVVRWLLRKQGVVLAGPDLPSLVDPVAPAQLRTEADGMIRPFVKWAYEVGMSRWKQPYLVLTLCRMLHTLQAGVVASKREAAEWALDALDADWAELIQRAIDDRPEPWGRVRQPAERDLVARTREFADYAASFAAAGTP